MVDIKRRCQIVCMTNDEKMSVLEYIADNYPEVRWSSGLKLTQYFGYNALFVRVDIKLYSVARNRSHIRVSKNSSLLTFIYTVAGFHIAEAGD